MKKDRDWSALPGFPQVFIRKYRVPNFDANSIAVLGPGPHVTIISPGPGDYDQLPESWPDLSQVSLHLVCPNSYHNLGVASWRERFPKARVYAARGAAMRLVRRGIRDL